MCRGRETGWRRCSFPPSGLVRSPPSVFHWSTSASWRVFSVLRDGEMPIRIRFECTRFPHWGAQSGYTQLIRHLDPQRHHTVLHAAADTDEDLAPWLAPFEQWL